MIARADGVPLSWPQGRMKVAVDWYRATLRKGCRSGMC